MLNYDDRYFVPVSNSKHGEVNDDTLFHYRQEGEVVRGTYSGGGVRYGTLIARVQPDGSLDMRYQHVNAAGELMTGVCRSTPEILPDGRIRLHESWRWTCGSGAAGASRWSRRSPRSAAQGAYRKSRDLHSGTSVR